MNMNTDLNSKALGAHADISALADGRLRGEDFARTLDLLEADSEARATWHAYHVIGDVLRAVPVGDAGQDMQLVHALREKLAQEPGYGRPASAALAAEDIKLIANNIDNSLASSQFGASIPVQAQAQAANDARWKWAAGLASVVAVAALAWNMAGGLGAGSGAQLASASPQVNSNVVLVSTPHGDVLRDARLVEMMAAHKQFGGTSALQMPSGFLRNATFDVPQR
jgi:sigma-E factor negative regulatory protein RseA